MSAVKAPPFRPGHHDGAMTAEVYVAESYSAVGRDVDNTSDSIVEDSLVLTVTRPTTDTWA